MTSQFNLHVDADSRLRFQLVNGKGEVLLTSNAFEDEDAAIAAIWSVREAAAHGSIIDLTGSVQEDPRGSQRD